MRFPFGSIVLPWTLLVALAARADAQCLSQNLAASDGGWGQRFGHSVEIAGDQILVGMLIDDEFWWLPGRAYVFESTATGWVERQILFPHDSGGLGDEFGISMSVYRDRVLIGRGGYGLYVFERSGDDWSEVAQIFPEPYAGNWFASRVDLFDDTAVAGSWYGVGGGHGAAHVFEEVGGTWSQTQQLLAPDPGTFVFGWSVAVHGDTVMVGALSTDLGGVNSGAVYVYEDDGTSWNPVQTLVPGDAGDGRHSVATSS